MILRPDHLVFIKTNFEFNGFLINEIEIDLVHVNFGKSKTEQRSNFGADFVAKVCIKFFSNKCLNDVGYKFFGNDLCRYFMLDGNFKGNNYRMVICFCTDKPNTIGVIALYKIEEK